MRYLLIGLCMSAGSLGCDNGPTAEPPATSHELSAAERLVLTQVDAYNRHDVDAFVDTYSLLTTGLDSLRSQYAGLFANMPNLRAGVSARIAMGNYVLLEERVTGLPGVDTMKAVVIYEVRDAKISRVWFIQ